MKTEDDKLKELFSKQLEEASGPVPDFQLMWKKAESARRLRVLWRVAASILLAVGVTAVILLSLSEKATLSDDQIAAWDGPTNSLVAPLQGSGMNTLTLWKSPTDFLLPENKSTN